MDQSFLVIRGVNWITHVFVQADGGLQLDYAGEPGQYYVVEFSKDLLSWYPLSTNTVDTLGNLQFTDTTAPNRPQSFYRVRAQ